MKRRRGRRGYWWWSWLLILATAGGVTGGYFYGEKRWEEAPKDYLGRARVSFKVRDPFVPRSGGGQITTSSVADRNEMEVLRTLKSEEVLSRVVRDHDLTRKWEMGAAEAVARLLIRLEFELDKSTEELDVEARLNDPATAAAVANTVAKMVPEVIVNVDEVQKAESLALLEEEAEPLIEREREARAALQQALAANGVNIKLVPGMKLEAYQEIPEVLSAKVAWDSTQEDVRDLLAGQAEYRNYWKKSLQPSLVLALAEPANRPVGPPVRPFQVRWATYGLTAGLLVGSLLMLAFWKLFP